MQRVLEPANFGRVPSYGVNLARYPANETAASDSFGVDVRAMQMAGIPIAINDHRQNGNASNGYPLGGAGSLSSTSDINIIYIGSHQSSHAVGSDSGILAGRYNIGFWAAGLQLPADASFLQSLDEIWAPSTFLVSLLSRLLNKPILHMPRALSGAADSAAMQLKPTRKSRFRFVTICSTSPQLTNLDGLIKAFKKAFPRSAGAELVICMACDDAERFSPRSSARSSTRSSRRNANIQVIHSSNYDELLKLIGSCDAYVSLHHVDPDGAQIAQAMAMGKPVIATAYSGNLDFMTQQNGFLISHRMAAIPSDVSDAVCGLHSWAEPDVDEAIKVMRSIVKDRKDAPKRAQQGRADVLNLLSAHTVGAQIRRRLDQIESRLALQLPSAAPLTIDSEETQKKREYANAVARLRHLVKTHVPQGETVAVISRGDTQLVQFEQRIGWHFPGDAHGLWTGYHPADDAAAIAALEAARTSGARFLLMPFTAFWWMDHYANFAQYLQRCYPMLLNTADGILFDLAATPDAQMKQLGVRVDFLMGLVSGMIAQRETAKATEQEIENLQTWQADLSAELESRWPESQAKHDETAARIGEVEEQINQKLGEQAEQIEQRLAQVSEEQQAIPQGIDQRLAERDEMIVAFLREQKEAAEAQLNERLREQREAAESQLNERLREQQEAADAQLKERLREQQEILEAQLKERLRDQQETTESQLKDRLRDQEERAESKLQERLEKERALIDKMVDERLSAIGKDTTQMDELAVRIASLEHRLDASVDRGNTMHESLESRLQLLQGTSEQIRPLEDRLTAMEKFLDQIHSLENRIQNLERLQERVDGLDRRFDSVEALSGRFDSVTSRVEIVERTKEVLESLALRIDHLERGSEQIQARCERMEHSIGAHAADAAGRINAISGRLESHGGRVEQMSDSSEAWLKELTAIATSISERLSAQEKVLGKLADNSSSQHLT